jgi:hypothetical protein
VRAWHRLVPLLDTGPNEMEILIEAAAEKGLEVFVAARVGMIGAAG